jgi:hypothetical protein
LVSLKNYNFYKCSFTGPPTADALQAPVADSDSPWFLIQWIWLEPGVSGGWGAAGGLFLAKAGKVQGKRAGTAWQ